MRITTENIEHYFCPTYNDNGLDYAEIEIDKSIVQSRIETDYVIGDDEVVIAKPHFRVGTNVFEYIVFDVVNPYTGYDEGLCITLFSKDEIDTIIKFGYEYIEQEREYYA